MKELNQAQQETLRFLRTIINKVPSEHPTAFRTFQRNLKKISRDRFEKRAFLYLDTLTWVESKVSSQTVMEVARAGFEAGAQRK